jgi:flagellar basal-body rod protein FlgF
MPVSRVMGTLVAGMIETQKQQDVISNNLANVNTNGFKKDLAATRAFSRFLDEAQQGPRAAKPLYDEIYHTNVLGDETMVVQEVKTYQGQGDMRLTGNTLDIALQGKGFIAIETEQGVRYTRNGSFMLNSNNELVTSFGHRVLGEGGADGAGVPIVVTGTNVAFLEDGTVQADGMRAGKLKINDFEDHNLLVKNGHSLFDYQGDPEGVQPVEAYSVEQGFLESSNVNAISEMTEMLQNTRLYEISGKALKSIEATINRMVTEVPKLK